MSSPSGHEQIKLWHRRLGHPNFRYLYSFPNLLKNMDCSFLQCESCIFAKSHHPPIFQNYTKPPNRFISFSVTFGVLKFWLIIKILQDANLEEVEDKGRYQRLVGRLIYLSHTRPNIAFFVSMVIEFMHSPTPTHFKAVYKILRYLKGNPSKGILIQKHDHFHVEMYTDANWTGSTIDRRSTSSYYSFVGGNLVTWCSKNKM